MPGTSLFVRDELGDAAELGAVDDRGARVWVRRPGADAATGTLRVAGRAPVAGMVALSGASDWIGVIELALPEPAPGAAFECAVGERVLRGRLAPALGARAALTFGFGSCHMPFAARDGRVTVRDEALIYHHMRGELRRAGADFLLLAGDQLYADYLPGLDVHADLPGDADHPPPLDTALAAYRRNYRGFFAEPRFRALREALPTLCMWDDHDIFNNWGSTCAKSPLDRTLFAAATKAYLEYQHPRNPPTDGMQRDGPPFPWRAIYGDIGVLALDLRGARDAATGSMLGPAQWAWAWDWLAGAEAARLATLFVVSSVPIAHVARWFTTLFDRLPERVSGSVRDRWSAAAFVDSRDALLDALCDWQAAGHARQVVLLSGDVHAASAFSIRRRDGRGVLWQWTSSAMTTPLIASQELFNRLVVRAPNLLEPRWSFERRFLSVTHNYGLVSADPLSGGGHRLRLALRAWQPRTRMLRTAATVVTSPAS